MRDRLWTWLCEHPQLVLVVLGVSIHVPFVGGGFLTDDFLHLARLERQTFPGVFSSPDTFGFYRPLPQASLLLNLHVSDDNASLFRLLNVLIHAAVICAGYAVARLLLERSSSAFFATLAFVLTPKAHPVAVLWISARAELLMALFSLIALIGWIRWQRGDRGSWLRVAWLCYLLALACKETALLLPLLLFFSPPGARYLTSARSIALAGTLCIAGAFLGVRLSVGALMPVSSDSHYAMTTPIERWLRNGRNYFWRALVSPAALVVAAAVARLSHWPTNANPLRSLRLWQLAMYAAVWFLVFMLPVLPIAARSELYLYLPVLGPCLLAGSLIGLLFDADEPGKPWYVAALVVYGLGIGAFQVSRAAALHADASFSAKFLQAIAESHAIRDHKGSIIFIPADDGTKRFVQDAIGGYIGTAVDRALGRHVPAGVGIGGTGYEPDALLLTCVYANGQVTLRPRSR